MVYPFPLVDCLTEHYAVEVDFANKWGEVVGEALYYANQSGGKPCVLMIIEKPAKDLVYLPRLYGAIIESGQKIKVWVIQPE